MPYLFLIAGLLVAGLSIYHFILKASAREITAVILSAGTLLVATFLTFLAVTGRLPAVLGAIAALIPILLSWWQAEKSNLPSQEEMDLRNALDILGLKDGARKEEIIAAHKKLMKKVHPDQDGSEGLAKSLNQARDLLLKDL